MTEQPQDESVYHLGVEFEEYVDAFTFPPESASQEAASELGEAEVVLGDLGADAPAEDDTASLALDEGDFWCGPMTYHQILADPAYQEWLRLSADLQAFVAANTLEEKLAAVALYQIDEFVPV